MSGGSLPKINVTTEIIQNAFIQRALNKIMTPEFGTLIDLERRHVITIGLKKDHANNLWYRASTLGKIMNWVTNVAIMIAIAIFVKLGFVVGLLSLGIIGIYAILIQRLACTKVRSSIAKNEDLFNAAYHARSCHIRDNRTGEITQHPQDWYLMIRSNELD